jgi:hypothetical protein
MSEPLKEQGLRDEIKKKNPFLIKNKIIRLLDEWEGGIY